MKTTIQISIWPRIIMGLLGMLLLGQGYAHEASALNNDAIDHINDAAVTSVLEVQGVLSKIFQRWQVAPAWPDPDLKRLMDQMSHLQEDTELTMEYFVLNGVNAQSSEELISNPRVGRSVAASQAVDTAIALLKHVSSLENQDTFVKEIYTSGMAAYMYNLLGAYREKMELYGVLMKTNPGGNEPLPQIIEE